MKLINHLVLEGHTSSVYTLTDLTGTSDFVSGGGDGWLVRWNKHGHDPNGRLIAKVDGKIFSSSYMPEYDLLLVGDMAGHLYWINPATQQIIKRLVLHQGSIFSIKISGHYIYTCGADGTVCRCHAQTMYPDLSVRLSGQGLRSLEIAGHQLWVGGSDNSISILDLDTFQIIDQIKKAHENTVFSLWYDGFDRMYSGGRDAMVRCWNLTSKNLLLSLPAHWYTINSIFGAGKDVLMTCSRDKKVRVWHRENMKLLYSADIFKDGHYKSVNAGIFLQDSELVATAGDDRRIILWKLSE